MLTNKQIETGERLEKAATDGPWHPNDDPYECDEIISVDDNGNTTLVTSVAGDIGLGGECDANMKLIIYLRNRAPDFLATVRQVAELKDALRKYGTHGKDCPGNLLTFDGFGPCDCGYLEWRDALAKAEETPE